MGIIDFLKNALFPNGYSCIICGCEIKPSQSGICADCRLPYNDSKICTCCGTPMTAEGKFCRDCPTAHHIFGINRSALILNDDTRRLIHKLKYGGGLWLAPYLAIPIAQTIAREQIDADILIPVPLHTSRLKKRGYNQSAALACQVGELLGIAVDENVLERIKDTPFQARMTRQERRENMIGAFELKNPEAVKNKRVLIIDDVFTTGSTIDCCAEALLRGKPAAINSVTLATSGHRTSAQYYN